MARFGQISKKNFQRWATLIASLLATASCQPGDEVVHDEMPTLETRISSLEHVDQRALRRQTIERLESGLGFAMHQGTVEDEDPAALKTRAIVALLSGDTELSALLLERTSNTEPTDADLWSTLAAARLEHARGTGNAFLTARALEAALRALELDEHHLPASFNAALALTRLSMNDAARKAWNALAAAESAAPWLAEIRLHIKTLPAAPHQTTAVVSVFEAAMREGRLSDAKRLAEQNSQRFRDFADGTLLPRWAQATAGQAPGKARSTWAQLQVIAAALGENSLDLLLSDLLDRLESLSAQPNFAESLAGALRKGGSSAALLASWPEEEITLGSALRSWLAFRAALEHYANNDYVAASSQLEVLLKRAKTRHPFLRGRALHLIGLIRQIEGDFSASTDALKAAISELEAAGEKSNAAKSATLISYNYDNLGQPEQAWQWLHHALSNTGEPAEPEERLYFLLPGQWLAMRQSMPRVALVIQNEVVAHAEASGVSFLTAEAYRWRAEIHLALKDQNAAQEDIKRAREHAERIDDQAILLETESALLVVESQILADGSEPHALAKLDEAVEILRASSYTFRLMRTLLQRARVLRDLGRTSDAERDLQEAISEAERQRLAIPESLDRLTFFDHTRQLFDTMVALQIDAFGDLERALEFYERAKARVLGDWLATHPSTVQEDQALAVALEPTSFDRLRTELPSEVILIEYALLDRRLVTWVFDDSGLLASNTEDIEGSTLERRVEVYRQTLLQGDGFAASQPLAEELYEILIRPVEQALPPGMPLVFIPDGPLHWLPFALLKDAKTGRYLLQNHLSATAPGAGVFATAARRRRPRKPTVQRRILYVSAPELHPSHPLDRLHAGETGDLAAGLYPGSKVLVGRKATRHAFLAAAPRYEILHFGGHSVPNLDVPLLSTLLFAPKREGDSFAKPDDSGVLYAWEVLEQDFHQAELIVLASCNTAFGAVSRTEGVQNLVRPFLAAGAPAVIAALWSVPNEATDLFFGEYYRQLSAGISPAEALRRTQLHFSAAQDPEVNVSTWGAFLLIGDGFPPR